MLLVVVSLRGFTAMTAPCRGEAGSGTCTGCSGPNTELETPSLAQKAAIEENRQKTGRREGKWGQLFGFSCELGGLQSNADHAETSLLGLFVFFPPIQLAEEQLKQLISVTWWQIFLLVTLGRRQPAWLCWAAATGE